MVNCADTFFAEIAAEAVDANATEPTGLVHLECWGSDSASSFLSDADTLTALMVARTDGVELDQPSRCGVNLGRFDAAEDGRVAMMFCMGNVEYYVEGQRMIAGFSSVIPLDPEELSLLESDATGAMAADRFDRLPLEWIVIVGASSGG